MVFSESACCIAVFLLILSNLDGGGGCAALFGAEKEVVFFSFPSFDVKKSGWLATALGIELYIPTYQHLEIVTVRNYA